MRLFSIHFSGIGPQYGKRATMIFACGDQTFFKVNESILTSSMLTKINAVASKSTIREFKNNISTVCWFCSSLHIHYYNI